MHPLAEQLVAGWIPHFQSADHAIAWLDIEREHAIWLDDLTMLVGRIDATGMTEAHEPFFADWKSLSASKSRRMDQVKLEWRFNPQALTYGLLCSQVYPGMTKFTVRWAIKPARDGARPTYDFEWYTYNPGELEWWRTQVLDIAYTIRRRRAIKGTNYPTNFTNCLRYGLNYACPFWRANCPRLDFTSVPEGMSPRIPHLDIERKLRADEVIQPDVVVLDATRIGNWFECQEKYRRLWEASALADGTAIIGLTESSDALICGGDMHTALAAYYMLLKEKGENNG